MNDLMRPSSSAIFMHEVAPAPGVSQARLERRLRAQPISFTPVARPLLEEADFSHRILRIEGKPREGGGRYLWEIVFEGVDLPGEEVSEMTLADAILEEVRERLQGAGVVVSSTSLAEVSPVHGSPKPVGNGFSSGISGAISFIEDQWSDWERYAPTSGVPEADKELPGEILVDIEKERAAIPPEPGLKRVSTLRGGHTYSGNDDAAHGAYVRNYIEKRAAAASPEGRRSLLAFLALQSRDGGTSAINTYDSQIITWGAGWGGRGGLGRVMERATANDAVGDLFRRCGLRYRGKQVYEVVDLASKKVVSGTSSALEVIRASVPLLTMLVHASRSPATRDAISEAQLTVFMEGSGNIPGAEAIHSQALITFIIRLKRLAPGYMTGVLDEVIPLVGEGPPSIERDRKIAALVVRYFYNKANKTKWAPDPQEIKRYWIDMKEDGLDCMDDPFSQAPLPPTGDLFMA